MRWLVGGQVYDVATATFRAADIGVDRGRIVTIAAGTRRASDDEVIDVSGRWLLPGLIDCHVHLTLPTDAGDPAAAARRSDAAVALYAAAAAERTVLGGVTTVRDVGGWNYVEMDVRDAVRAGTIRGPRMFLAGKLLSITTSTVDYYPGMYDVADGADAVRAAARRQLAHGADLIKVMATGALLSSETEDARAIQFTLDELRAAVEIARDNHKHVAAHCHALAGVRNAVEAGVDSIEHGTFADDAVLRRMAERGISLVPTICAGELLLRDGEMLAAMPVHLRERMVEVNDVHVAAVRRAHELGVPIAMGTDAGTPGNHHGLNAHECVFMVEHCGLTPAGSIAAATVNAARLLRQPDLGSLHEGAHADVIACDANPLDDITTLTRLTMVMAAGRVVSERAPRGGSRWHVAPGYGLSQTNTVPRRARSTSRGTARYWSDSIRTVRARPASWRTFSDTAAPGLLVTGPRRRGSSGGCRCRCWCRPSRSAVGGRNRPAPPRRACARTRSGRSRTPGRCGRSRPTPGRWRDRAACA